MPHEGFVDPVMNDGPGFHSNMPISELTERVTRAIEASDVSSSPLVVETVDRVMHGTWSTPTKTYGARATQPEIRRPGFEGWPTKGPRPPHVK